MDTLNRKYREQVVNELSTLSTSLNRVSAHIKADTILCNVLLKLGYKNIVTAYEKISKQYA